MKIALVGFSRVALFPVEKNDSEGYAVGERFDVPWAQEMSQDQDNTEQKIYADDMLYINLKNFNGINVNITFVEMPLDLFEPLGFGSYDKDTKILRLEPQSANKEYGITFRCGTVDGGYRLYKFYNLTVTSLKETGIKTRGEGMTVNTYQLSGTLTRRRYDDAFADMKDIGRITDPSQMAQELLWLNTIDAVPPQTP